MRAHLRSTLAWALLCWGGTLFAQAPDPLPNSTPNPTERSALDGPLFFQILLGEMQVREGAPGAGFSMLLDAARRLRDPALFQRAVDVAIEARSGEAALQAAQSWRRELTGSPEANRYILQILLALGRTEEAGTALAQSLADLPDSEKAGAIASVPRVFARVADKALAAAVVEKALAASLQENDLRASAWTTIGRMHRQAQQWSPALAAAQQGHQADPQAQGPLILAIGLLGSGQAGAQALLEPAMRVPRPPELRLGYARALINLNDNPAALEQLNTLVREHANFAPGWLVRGLLQNEMGQTDAARTSLERHVQLMGDAPDPEAQAGLNEAIFALSQLAQQKGQLAAAAQWLARLPTSADPVRVAIRRAEVLDQQGRDEEARAVLTQVQPLDADQAKRKALALARWWREHRQAEQALQVLQTALNAAPQDPDLLTELSLVLDKLERYEQMETLLRQMMLQRPQDPHAFNALGYSLADRGLRLEEARELILKAVALAPNDPYIQDSLGWVEFRMGRPQEALRILQQAYRARPDAEIAAHLGEVLWSLGRRKEAGTIWREGLMLKADNDTLQETLRRLGFKP